MFQTGDRVLIKKSKNIATIAEDYTTGIVISVEDRSWEDGETPTKGPEYVLGIDVGSDGIYYRFQCDVCYDIDVNIIEKLLKL